MSAPEHSDPVGLIKQRRRLFEEQPARRTELGRCMRTQAETKDGEDG